jgi:biotin carboxylase
LYSYLQANADFAALYPIGISAIAAVQAMSQEQHVDIPVISVSAEVLAIFDDKDRANAVVKRAGVAVPAHAEVQDLDGLSQAADALGYPIIIKSGNNAGPVLGRKAYIVNDRAELESGFGTWPPEHQRLLVQRFVEGHVVACDFVASAGEIIAYFEGGHARTNTPDGTGYVVDFRAAAPTPTLFEALRKIVSHTGYSGPGLLQCVIDHDTGTCHFIELNPRLSAGVAEVVNAGLDLPLIALQSGLGHETPPALTGPEPRYRVNAHSYWFERDIVGWLNQRQNLSWSESVRWLGLMCSSLATCEAHINWRWRDPGPSIRILTEHLRRAVSPFIRNPVSVPTKRSEQ